MTTERHTTCPICGKSQGWNGHAYAPCAKASQYIAASASGYWGRGDTPLAAFQRLTQAAGRRPLKRDVTTLAIPAGAKPDSAYVTPMGGVGWEWEESARDADGNYPSNATPEVPTVTR